MSSQVLSQLVIARLLQIYILQGNQNCQSGTNFGCQNWSDQTDSGSKSGPGEPILAKCSAKIDPLGIPNRFWGDSTINNSVFYK